MRPTGRRCSSSATTATWPWPTPPRSAAPASRSRRRIRRAARSCATPEAFPPASSRTPRWSYITRVIPKMTPEQRLRAVKRALGHAASLGVTSVQDMNPTLRRRLGLRGPGEPRRADRPHLRGADGNRVVQTRPSCGIHRSFGSPWLRLGAVKGYADGSLGSTTAYFFEPYLDAPGTRGLLSDEMQDVEQMRTRLMAADHARLQLCIHAIGDAGISQMLDLFGDIVRGNGERDRRFRIEHAQHIAPKDFDRFARAEGDRVGPAVSCDRRRPVGGAAHRAGAHQDDLRVPDAARQRRPPRAGHRLAGRAAQPDADALRGDDARDARRKESGRLGAGAEDHRSSEAVAAYTSGSAFAEFQEGEKGTIARGKLADLVILSDDVFTHSAGAASRTSSVLTTVVGGKVVHQRNPVMSSDACGGAGRGGCWRSACSTPACGGARWSRAAPTRTATSARPGCGGTGCRSCSRSIVRQSPWPHARAKRWAPLGYRPSPKLRDAIVPLYAPGLPLLMALLQAVAGYVRRVSRRPALRRADDLAHLRARPPVVRSAGRRAVGRRAGRDEPGLPVSADERDERRAGRRRRGRWRWCSR